MSEHERDVLITRVIDDEASPADWEALKALAAADPSIWQEVAEAQHARSLLADGVAEAIAIADEVVVPVEEHARWRFSQRLRLGATWAGWAAAASLGVIWATGLVRPSTTPMGMSEAGLVPTARTHSQALQDYLSLGREAGVVVDQMPDLVVMSAKQSPDGKGYEVLYLRQVLERAVVDDFYKLGKDELGRDVPVGVHRAPVKLGPM